MVATFHFCDGTSCQLELDGATYVQPASHQTVASEKLAENVRAALEKPIGYPPLSEATVPGDQVVVALQRGLPHASQVVAGVEAALSEAGIEPAQTTFLYTKADSGLESVLDKLAIESGIRPQCHNPAKKDDCSFVGVTESGIGLRMNRKLADADIVLPIGLTTVDLNRQTCDKFCGLLPDFCDQETIAQYQDRLNDGSAKHRQNRRREIDEAGWLLGVGMAVQIVPGRGGTVAAVLAGDPVSVAPEATEQYNQLWCRQVDSAGDLIVATISGPASKQSWDTFARALSAAESVVEPAGAIAIFSELTEPPGPSLRRLVGCSDYSELERELMRDCLADKQTALLLCRTLEQTTVYLHSGLDADLVESLGLAPIASESELLRLASSYRRPVVLEDAHRLLPRLSSAN